MKALWKASFAVAVLWALSAGLHAAEPVTVSEAWKTMDVAGLASEAQRLHVLLPLSGTTCGQLGQYVSERYMADAAAGPVDIRPWLDVVLALGTYVPAGTRAAMIERIQTQLMPTVQAITDLAPADLTRLVMALRRLEAPAALIGSISATWVAGSEKYKTLSGEELVLQAQVLGKVSDAGKAARVLVVAHVETELMKDAETIRSVPLVVWGGLIAALKNDLTDDAKMRWAGSLHAAYASDEVLSKLTRGERDAVAIYLNQLGPPSWVLPAWVEKSNAWRAFKPEELIVLANDVPSSGEAGRAARARILQHVEAMYLANAAAVTSVTCGQWWDLARLFAGALSADARKMWLARLRTAYIDDAGTFARLKSGDVIALSEALGLLGDTTSKVIVVKWLGGK